MAKTAGAIDKTKGGGGENYAIKRYEGFGPGGCMIIVDCLTDNVTRTFTDARVSFNKHGGKLVGPGINFEVDNISYEPPTLTDVSGEDAEAFGGLLKALNDCNDVQQVYHNAEFVD